MDLRRIDSDSIVDMVFYLKWKSGDAVHTDGYQASRINIWRDFIPPFMVERLKGKQAGERIEMRFKAGQMLPAFDGNNIFKVKNDQFDRRLTVVTSAGPGVGRFYPRGMLKNIAGVFSANVQPFRFVDKNNGHMTVDFNHPLADKELMLTAIVGKVETKEIERGGSSVDWMEVLTSGPGMQSRWRGQQTDFFSAEAFRRDDEADDSLFYSKPRYVQHIDGTAIEMVRNTYGRFLKDDMEILDLMSSWQSHLPENLRFKDVTGLGLNQNELKRNSRLNRHVIQDLNQNPVLPFESDTFDAVVCTVSVEYLVNPLAVFKEVSRVLRADGFFIVTFSNRWFPTKAIRIWKELHEFERLGMVLEFFIRSEGFKNLQTYSFRGLPRPRNDKYFPELRYSDPVYAIWGQKM
jgi:SAM-dependent methyltransferase